MAKRKRFRCPFCGMLSYRYRLEKRYPLELVDVKSSGRGLIKNVFIDWDSENPLYSVFQRHFYTVLEYLLRHKYVDAGVVKELADVYVKAPDVFRPEDVILRPEDVVLKPEDVILTKTEVIK